MHDPAQQHKPEQRGGKKEYGGSENTTLAQLPQARIYEACDSGNDISSGALAVHFWFSSIPFENMEWVASINTNTDQLFV